MAKKQPIKRPGELRDDAEAILWQGRNTNTDKVEELVNELLAEIGRLTTEVKEREAQHTKRWAECIKQKIELKTKDAKIDRLKQLLSKITDLPMNSASDYDEHIVWLAKAEQVLKD